MDDLLNHIYANGVLLVMWGALLFHLVVPIPRELHPISLWRKFAELLASKVNTQGHYSQSIVSGMMAWLLMCVPAYAVLWALKPLVWQPQLFELALLLIALDWRTNEKLASQLIPALAQDNKPLAKRSLTHLVNRDTSPLSTLGLGKAGAETLILGYGRNVVAVLFWYGIAGGMGALLYRFTSELAREWSPAKPSFRPFGLPVVRILAVLDFLPLRLFSVIIAIGHRFTQTIQLLKQQSSSWPLPGPSWLLITVGAKLELSLGGPAMYGKQKAVRAKLGGRIAPSAIHLAQIQKLIAWRLFAWIVIQSLIMALIYQGI